MVVIHLILFQFKLKTLLNIEFIKLTKLMRELLYGIYFLKHFNLHLIFSQVFWCSHSFGKMFSRNRNSCYSKSDQDCGYGCWHFRNNFHRIFMCSYNSPISKLTNFFSFSNFPIC